MSFPHGSVGKESICKGDTGSVPGSGRSPGEGSGNPLQCFSLESPVDGGDWGATVHGLTESLTTTERLNTHSVMSAGVSHSTLRHLPRNQVTFCY